jgi:hypothetical protein
MRFYLIPLLFITCLFSAGKTWALSKTLGTPLGGMGTGYVIYNAVTGDFAASGKIPPFASDMESEFKNKKSLSSGFNFFVGGQEVKKAHTDKEDAKCPLYTADFGIVNNVHFTLEACGPFIPGDDPLYYQLATSPLAFFKISATNEGDTTTEVAVGMEFTNKSVNENLLGGADNGVVDSVSGKKMILFQGDATAGNACLMVDCDGISPMYSVGAAGTFGTNGMLADTAGNHVAAKCSIPPGGTVRFKYVLSWWRSFVSTVDRYGSGKVDEDNYYYHNYFTDSKQAAEFGMIHFDKVVNGGRTIVNRVMGSNFPEFYKERLLNDLYPMIHNSICAKDGRVAFWEGHYAHIGIIDQAQHAALWYAFNWPQHQWNELQYWYRTAHTGVGEDASLKGQIHHDFNTGEEFWSESSRFMCPWDNYLRDDYWYHPNTTNWSDLNSMVIFKTYELMLATGNLDSMKVYVPKAIITADRLMTMCTAIGKHIPVESRSTYDTEGDATPNYLAGITLTTWLVMEELTKFIGDTVSAQKYREWYTAAHQEFVSLIYSPTFCKHSDYAEGDLAGYSWANYYCLEPIMEPEIVNEGCKRLWQYYASKSSIQKKLGRWHFYTCDHWGGTEIARGKPDTAMIMFKWDYDYFYAAHPNMVFWQDLWVDNTTPSSYLTAPSVWRSYFQMTGYLFDNAHQRLWIRPRIPAVMDQQITNAPLLNTKSWGNLNYDGKLTEIPGQTLKRIQKISVAFDSTVSVKEIVLNNNTGMENPSVIITSGGTNIDGFTCTAEGAGIEKNIRILFGSPVQIGPSGLQAEVFTDQASVSKSDKVLHKSTLLIKNAPADMGKIIQYTVNSAGPVVIDLLQLNGKKTATVLQQNLKKPGTYNVIWKNRRINGVVLSPAMMVLRLTTHSGSICKLVTPEFR